jgi:hypothetical protein
VSQVAGRKLHVVDAENLVGRGRCTAAELTAGEVTYRRLGLVDAGDHVVVGCNPFVALDAGRAWAGCRLVIGHGRDGADRALLDVLSLEHVEERFVEVVIVSGDGIFLEPTVRIQQHHVPVTVVARAGSLSVRLRLAASRVIELEDPRAPEPAVRSPRAA